MPLLLRRLVVAWFLLQNVTTVSVGANEPRENISITVLSLPSRNVSPTIQDLVYAAIARELRNRYSADVLSGRAVARSVWGTLGSGLEEASMRLTSAVAEGKRAYQLLQIPQALSHLNIAALQEEICGSEIRDPAVLTDLHVYTALVHFAKGSQEEAVEEFKKAIAHEPELEISTKQFAPDVVEAFQRAKNQLSSQQTMTISILSSVPGAEVHIDGKRRGKTPMKDVALLPGHHFVRLELEGHSPWTINLPQGVQPAEIRARLVPLWMGEPPESLLSSALSVQRLDEKTLSQLRLLSGFFEADALLLTWLDRRGESTLLGVRLFVTTPEIVGRSKVYNLGAELSAYEKRIRGVVGTLKELTKVQRAGEKRQVAISQNKKPFSDEKTVPLPPTVAEKETSVVPWYTTWWFWTTVGVVTAGALATGLGFGLTSSSQEDGWTLRLSPQ